MPAIYNQFLSQWIDSSGLITTKFLSTQDQSPFVNADLSSLAAAMQALSVCGLQGIQFQQTIMIGNDPTTGSYPSVYDEAQFIAKSSPLTQAFFVNVPGPKSTIFLPDTKTVDMTNTDVVAFVAAVMAAVGTPTGAAFTSVPRGIRSRVKWQSS